MNDTTTKNPGTIRYLVAAALVVAAFFGAYRFAAARTVNASDATVAGQQASAGAELGAAGTGADGSTPACACCGTSAPTKDGLTGDAVEGTAVVENGVQRLEVDLSKGYYEPNVLVLKAGVPAQITFAQSTGCTAQVMSKDLGFFEDLSAGPRTIELDALEAGDYAFSCGMEMVFGKIVVE